MQELEAQRKESTLPSNNQVTTTLVIQNVPSEIAYETIMKGIESGNYASREEIQTAVDEGLGDRSARPKKYPDLGIINEEIHLHNVEWEKVNDDEMITEICRCKECGAIVAHKVHSSHSNQIFTEYEHVNSLFRGIEASINHTDDYEPTPEVSTEEYDDTEPIFDDTPSEIEQNNTSNPNIEEDYTIHR